MLEHKFHEADQTEQINTEETLSTDIIKFFIKMLARGWESVIGMSMAKNPVLTLVLASQSR